MRRRVLVVTLDTIGDRMAGPAIRAWEIAQALAAEHDVRLVTFGACTRSDGRVSLGQVTVDGFRAEVERVDVVVVQGFVFATFPWLQTCEQVLVVDLYDPFQIETLEVDRFKPRAERQHALRTALAELAAQLRRGDLFLCASARQRDLWIGHLTAAGRVNPDTYDADPNLSRLLTVVPFGMPAEPPRQATRAIKGAVDGIGPDDVVLLWGGGVYNWFDPITLVRAVDRLRHEIPTLRLYFLGMRHPNPDVPEMAVAARTRRLAEELHLVGSHVFFNEEWVPYERRADFLLDADIGVSCHFDHVETEFSFRTRILDYLWAGLPIVSTRGDSFAAMVEREGLGRTVPAADVEALVDALRDLITRPDELASARAAVRRVAPSLTWPEVLAPVLEFCREPRRAADAEHLPPIATPERPSLAGRVISDVRAVGHHLRAGGPRQLLAKVRWRLASNASRRRG
ncbi:glycosyltransferase family 4 protein [Isoptericola sp. b441]|uniref:Glycosyltransferase family 4 protein n=1 Tax=Actinotalea lenta TaxID=3064654 RepID=A0ABT9DFC4_9CELL|nr:MULTISPECIES: glycosyltransferase family 4 protein [unclassified Isoptericola]MDO8108552.1 glycosyltransferase family 4 protein [Isoptericola sp. b441]MDO8119962.1 glycosyltransferase family 4 protein [Isoptericola sp. b490]